MHGCGGWTEHMAYDVFSLVARDVLAEPVGRTNAPSEGVGAILGCFETDIQNRSHRQLPSKLGKLGREDAYQEVCLKLI